MSQTDSTKNVVLQYEQAKKNLQRKEDELAKKFECSFCSDLKRLNTEMVFKSRATSDSILQIYKKLQVQLEQKAREYEYISSFLEG